MIPMTEEAILHPQHCDITKIFVMPFNRKNQLAAKSSKIVRDKLGGLFERLGDDW